MKVGPSRLTIQQQHDLVMKLVIALIHQVRLLVRGRYGASRLNELTHLMILSQDRIQTGKLPFAQIALLNQGTQLVLETIVLSHQAIDLAAQLRGFGLKTRLSLAQLILLLLRRNQLPSSIRILLLEILLALLSLFGAPAKQPSLGGVPCGLTAGRRHCDNDQNQLTQTVRNLEATR
jgi:hypothetical protein